MMIVINPQKKQQPNTKWDLLFCDSRDQKTLKKCYECGITESQWKREELNCSSYKQSELLNSVFVN